MITLQLHPDLAQKVAAELRSAGAREIGGVLVGEHVGADTFRIVDLSVQRSGGGHACFVRRPEQHKRFLDAFFARTGQAFERYNYLGEWHSHPLFTAEPSGVDFRQMQDIVSDGPQAPLFAVLLVIRLSAPDNVELSAHAFRAHHTPERAEVVIVPRPEGDPPPEPVSWWRRLWTPTPPGERGFRLV